MAKYTYDINLKKQLIAKALGCPHAHCKITSIDTNAAEATPAEFVPAFLAYSPPPDESWLANHVNLLAVLVLILSIVVAVVVFR